jgi:hypothetical protein
VVFFAEQLSLEKREKCRKDACRYGTFVKMTTSRGDKREGA